MALVGTMGGDGSLFVGEDKIVQLELLDPSGVPVDMSAMSIVFDVRLHDDSTDYVFNRAASLVGVYSATRSANTQRAQVLLSDDDLNAVTSGRKYRQSWKRMDSGVETVLEWGDFIPQKATAP